MVNLDPDFIQAAASFLNCIVGATSFTFLGISVGVNPRRREVWKPIVARLRNRLESWQNRHLSMGEGFFVKLSFVKYGDIRRTMLSDLVIHKRNMASLWWKDVCSVGSMGNNPLENWFPSSVACKLGNGEVIDFWADRWVGGYPLRNRFPSLFSHAEVSSKKVSDNGFWNNGSWVWSIKFHEGFSVEDEGESLLDLLRLINPIQPVFGVSDLFVWWKNPNGFSVKAIYEMTMEGDSWSQGLNENVSKELSSLWKTKIPSKVSIFGWSLILNKIPTRKNLASRGILLGPDNLVCPLCLLAEEDTNHLFGSCSVTLWWWNSFLDWLRIDVLAIRE
ncbi:uncharacterized protein LOC131633769 [Vicia villosa]|uniref:uncharacterized protein LOC131633769 n=1 Tax=Vicia villosa TaxID=3911 RepID=UPI00273B0E7B|nr:uncharacterized protein LOC131633769 [Vicia villosa]